MSNLNRIVEFRGWHPEQDEKGQRVLVGDFLDATGFEAAKLSSDAAHDVLQEGSLQSRRAVTVISNALTELISYHR